MGLIIGSGIQIGQGLTFTTTGGTPPAPSDSYFNYVSLLLNGDGTNGAQNNTFLDSSTNNFTITRNGNTTQGSFSPYGNLWSNYFDGSSYLSAPAGSAWAFGTGDFTVETWINTNTTNSQQCITGTYLNSSSGFSFTIETSNNYLKVRTLGDPVVLTGNVTVTPNVWHHVAVVRSSGTITLYLDGTSCGSTSNSDNITSNGVAMYIGQLGNSSGYVNGYLSNVRIVKGTAVYTSNFTPSTTPLTAVSGTQLLTSQSNRFIDNSSNAFALTVNGSPSVQRFSPFLPTQAYSTTTNGGSGYFNGSNSTLDLGGQSQFAFGTNDFTIECWIYVPSFGSGAVICGMRPNGVNGPYPQLGYGSSGQLATYVNSNNTIVSSTDMNINTWNHVAWVRHNGVSTLYQNGVSVGTASDTTNYSVGANRPILGINDFNESSNAFNGYMSNFRIVNGTAVYTTNFTPSTTPLTAISGTSLLLNDVNVGIPDLSQNNVLQTVGSAQVSTSVYKYGTGSLSFNGSSDYLIAPPNRNFNFATTGSDFTIEAWIYPSSTGSISTIASVWTQGGVNNGDQWIWCVNNGTLQFYWEPYDDTNPFISGGSVPNNTWTYCAITKKANAFTLWVNGVATATGTNSGTTTGTYQLDVGKYGNNSSSYWNGYIDDLRITSGYARYTTNFTPPTQALPTY